MIREIETRWKELEANYTQLFDAAREKVKPYKNLIGYLDEISKESDELQPTKPIHADYADLAKNT